MKWYRIGDLNVLEAEIAKSAERAAQHIKRDWRIVESPTPYDANLDSGVYTDLVWFFLHLAGAMASIIGGPAERDLLVKALLPRFTRYLSTVVRQRRIDDFNNLDSLYSRCEFNSLALGQEETGLPITAFMLGWSEEDDILYHRITSLVGRLGCHIAHRAETHINVMLLGLVTEAVQNEAKRLNLVERVRKALADPLLRRRG